MIPAIRSELRKFFTTRMWWGMAIGMFIAGAAFAALFGFLLTSDVSAGPPGQEIQVDAVQLANSVYVGGLGIGYLLTLTIGIMQIGSEYRHKTITSTFLSTPNRLRAMLAKVVALLVIGALYGLISLIGSVTVGAVVLNARGADPFPGTEVLRTLALSLLVLGLWALIGLGIGILIPNQVAAILIGVGVAWIVEPLLGFGMNFWEWGREHVAPYLPSAATNSVVNAAQSAGEIRLEWWGGALVLAAYAIVLSGFGIWRTMRADIA